ncbi:MAG: hypothetical protein KDB95_12785 [Flavobacteriales bacterium]|nr:hypothetical protein [Flavobacteriales bacterium]
MNIRTLILSAAITCCGIASAQPFAGRVLALEEIAPAGMPGLQSFAWGTHDGQWLLIGGRTDGLHRRQPPVSFLASGNNVNAYVVDPATWQVWSAALSALPQNMLEQLQSTNMEFDQQGSTLYCIGGYGYSPTNADHVTYSFLTAIDLPGAMDAIRNGTSIIPYFRQITDPRMAVTGGQLRKVGDHFNLVGGQRFMGRYNPMGPDFGPGFVQEYTNAIRRFTILDDGVDLTIDDYWTLVDTVNLHRRDYNLLPQIFPNGEEGLTAFSGVFRYDADLPWLNTVDIQGTNVTVNNSFEQLFNQYHSAHACLYEGSTQTMRSIFFGGIGRYQPAAGGGVQDDTNVPFVNTISLVERDGAGQMTESAIGQMPALLGASAEFIPWPATEQTSSGILLQDAFAGDTVVLGHIVGGIESSAANIFFINTGTQSSATNKVYRVLLVDPTTAVSEVDRKEGALRVTANGQMLNIEATLPGNSKALVRLLDSTGRVVRHIAAGVGAGEHRWTVDMRDLAPGPYLIEVHDEHLLLTRRVLH